MVATALQPVARLSSLQRSQNTFKRRGCTIQRHVHPLKTRASQSLTGKQKWGESERERERGVKGRGHGSKWWSLREWNWGVKSQEQRTPRRKRRVKLQEEPSQMKAVIKRLASDKYRGISQLLLLLPATGWSHTEGMKERAQRQRSHIPLFPNQSRARSSCVFTALPEGIKVNMLAYPQLPRINRPLAAFISASSTLLPSISPSPPIIPLSCHPAPSQVQFGICLFGPVIRQHKSAASPSASLISCA